LKTVAIIPARSDSKRLPTKHLREILGHSMLYYLVERLQKSSFIDMVVVATTDRACDDDLAKEASKLGAGTYRGDLNDVLKRFTEAAKKFNADIVIKANGDNPIQAPEVIKNGINFLVKNQLSCVTAKNAYTGLPIGLGSEVLTMEALLKLDQEAPQRFREDNTVYIFKNPGFMNWAPIPVKPEWVSKDLSVTVDTPEDFIFMSKIINALKDSKPEKWKIEQIISIALSIYNNKKEC